eukprot:2436148-Prymnesium_polylepis.1
MRGAAAALAVETARREAIERELEACRRERDAAAGESGRLAEDLKQRDAEKAWIEKHAAAKEDAFASAEAALEAC